MPVNREALPGLIPENKWARKTMEGLMGIFVPRVYLHGRANLQELRRLRELKKPQVKIANHRSNLDAPVIDKALRTNGFADIAEEDIYIKGKKLQDEIVTRFLTKIVPSFLVWPRSIPAVTEEEKKERRAMNLLAIKSSKKALQQENSIVVFPEGGRSRTGGLTKPIPEVAGYFSLLEDEIVVPIGIVGTDKILPVGSRIPRRGEVHIIVGRPFAVSDLTEHYKDLPKEERREAIMDHAMRELAYTLPPDYRGIYAEDIGGKLRT